jgi:chemotaxis protein MotB
VARQGSGSSASNGVTDRVSLVKYPADPRNRRVAITLFYRRGLFAK